MFPNTTASGRKFGDTMTTKRGRENVKTMISTDEFDIKQQGGNVVIEGFANKATVDRGDEMIATDAWDLSNYKKNPVILYNHGMDKLGGTPIGKALEVRPTEDGLFLKVQISKSKAPDIQMIRDLIEERILRAFSVGFNPIQTENVDLDGKSIRKITKAELFEVSVVGIPMNQDSLFSLSEKGFHAVKSLLLKEKGATRASEVEDLIGRGDRKAIFARVAKAAAVPQEDILDMTAGNKEISDEILEHFRSEIKSLNLKEALEQALASLEEGVSPEEIRVSLAATLATGEQSEEAEKPEEDAESAGKAEDEDKPKEEGEGDSQHSGEEPPAPKEEGDGDALEEPEDSRRKADFQDCVAAKVPALLEEGMERDEAVATAIAKCQEEGKCELTPAAKSAAYAACFTVLDSDSPNWGTLVVDSAFTKQVDETAQSVQPPTTALSTEPSEDQFGSPFLDAAKQTNVLLGALISEMQAMRKELSTQLTSATFQNSVQSEEDKPKVEPLPSEGEEKSQFAGKAISELDTKLKAMGY